MTDAAHHYETLLARHYTWMVGTEFGAKAGEQKALLEELGAKGQGLAIDLGSGPGYQAVALAQLGFSPVLAVDMSEILLDELGTHARGLPIKPVRGDIRDLAQLAAPGSASAIVCMGDTLTHLESRADVSHLLADAHQALKPGGVLALTFRDLSIAVTQAAPFSSAAKLQKPFALTRSSTRAPCNKARFRAMIVL